MTKIMHAVIAAAASILLFAGCSSVSAEAQDAPTPSASSTPSSESSAAGQVAAIKSAPSPSASPARDNMNQIIELGDARYLEAIRRSLRALDGTSDAQLIAYGKAACEQMANGATKDSVSILTVHDERLTVFAYNFGLATAAADNYCTDYR